KILVVVAAFKAVTSSYGSVMNTFHLNKKSFMVTAVYGPFHITASIIGSFFGVAGIASAVGLVKIIFMNWNIWQIMDAMSQKFRKWYAALTPYFFVNMMMVVLLSLALGMLQLPYKPLVLIILTGVVFVLCYIAIFKTILKKELNNISFMVGAMLPRASRYFNLVFGL
ncbi:MAG: hypothetical protein ACTHKV_00105, partial [Flavipsychrobacter sp.]